MKDTYLDIFLFNISSFADQVQLGLPPISFASGKRDEKCIHSAIKLCQSDINSARKTSTLVIVFFQSKVKLDIKLSQAASLSNNLESTPRYRNNSSSIVERIWKRHLRVKRLWPQEQVSNSFQSAIILPHLRMESTSIVNIISTTNISLGLISSLSPALINLNL